MSLYWATWPTSSAPLARRRATVSSTLSTVTMTLRRPSVFGGAIRRFDLDQFWIAKLRQLKPPVPTWPPHHDGVDLNTFEPVDAVHPRALDRRLAFERH